MKLLYSLIVYTVFIPSTLSSKCTSNDTEPNLSQNNNEWKKILRSCTHPQNIKKLQLEDNGISAIDAAIFENLTSLSELNLRGNRIGEIKPGTFRYLTSLETLHLAQNRLQKITRTMFADLSALKTLHLEGNIIENIAVGAFDKLTSLTSLFVGNNSLREIPQYTVASSITALDASENPIQSIRPNVMKKYRALMRLFLDKTKIRDLPDDVFTGNPELAELRLTDGPLKTIRPRAFEGPSSLTRLNLSATAIEWLPSSGIEHLTHLYIKNVFNLWQIPVVSFKNLQKAEVTYHYHCCLIHSAYTDGKIGRLSTNAQTSPLRPCANVSSTTTPMPTTKASLNGGFPVLRPRVNTTPDARLPNDTCYDPNMTVVTASELLPVTCSPPSDAFNPCEDVLGSHVLRVFSWIVMVFAVIGNAVKILVLLFNQRPMTINKMLTLNLAIANLCLGLYLTLLVAIDLHSYGVYQNYARAWQFGGGCQGAGFLSIFSTEMAVYTLTLITVERYFMIVHPLENGKHLSFKQIARLLVLGWVFSLTMATLPLFEVSSYEKVAICLPFDVEGVASRVYVTFLLATNGLAFFTVLFCYTRMYLSLGPSAPSAARIEQRVAKRMALLIFTNFACWFPIALLSLIAIYGHPLINVKTSKFLLVFIYPINSFTNPYLYAIGTKAFQLDVLVILSKCSMCSDRIEERSNRLRSKLDIAPTNSTRVSSNNGSGLSLNSTRSNANSKSNRKKRKCSCILLCMHERGAYELKPITQPAASPSLNSRDGSQGSGSIAGSSPDVDRRRTGRRSSAKQIFVDGEFLHCDSYRGHDRDEEDGYVPNNNGRDEMTSSLLRPCEPSTSTTSESDAQVGYKAIPVVQVTTC